MQRAHKIRLVPNSAQLTALRKAAGTARYVYNWGLEAWNKQYEEYKQGKAKRPDAYQLSRRWTKERPTWARETYRGSQTKALMNLGLAWHKHWNIGVGKPAFKKKSGMQSFYIDNAHSYVREQRVHLPNIGNVKMREPLRLEGKILSYTVSCQAEQWHVSIQVELSDPPTSESSSVVGVDVGVSNIAFASDGSVLTNPCLLQKAEPKIKHLSRKLSRQVKGSARRRRTLLALQRQHLKVANARNDAIHKFTTALSKNHGLAVVETLDIRRMQEIGSKQLRYSLQDTAMKEVHRQLGYKMRVEHAPKYFKSSKTCSSCGSVKLDLPLSVRTYRCPRCGLVLDRDLNAAINLRDMRWVTASTHVEPAHAGCEA